MHKRLLFLFPTILIFMGIVGVIWGIAVGNNTKQAIPIYSVNGIFVDSKGTIYIGNSHFSRIQVFNNSGEYLYSIVFDSGLGSYWYYVTSEDQVRIITVRNKQIYTFYNQEIVAQSTLDSNSVQKAIKEFSSIMGKQKYFVDDAGNQYFVNGKKIAMRDGEGRSSRVILNTPLLPFSITANFMLIVFGAIIIVILVFAKKTKYE